MHAACPHPGGKCFRYQGLTFKVWFMQEAKKEQQEAPKAEAKAPAKKGAQPSKADTSPKQVADEPGKYPSKESIGPFCKSNALLLPQPMYQYRSSMHAACWLHAVPSANMAFAELHEQSGANPVKRERLCAAGVTGGFAGGERGVQQFVEKGDVELAPEGQGTQIPDISSHHRGILTEAS